MTAGYGPIAITLDGIDFTVVGQIAKRLCQAPLRPGIGGKALVEDAQRGLEFGVTQVLIEHRQVSRHHQALIGNDTRGQARDIKHGVGRLDLLFGPAARYI